MSTLTKREIAGANSIITLCGGEVPEEADLPFGDEGSMPYEAWRIIRTLDEVASAVDCLRIDVDGITEGVGELLGNAYSTIGSAEAELAGHFGRPVVHQELSAGEFCYQLPANSQLLAVLHAAANPDPLNDDQRKMVAEIAKELLDDIVIA